MRPLVFYNTPQPMKIVIPLLLAAAAYAGNVAIRPAGVFLFDGKPAFPIGFTTAPPPTGTGYAALAKNGIVFNRCGIPGKWGPEAESALDQMLDLGAKQGMLCAIYIPELSVIEPGD